MRVVKINTSAYKEEDFFLLTTLDDQHIIEVINPIVNAERDGYESYDNNTLVDAIKTRFPLDYVCMFTEFETITI